MASISDRRWATRAGQRVRTTYVGDRPWRLQWQEYAKGPRKTEHFPTQTAARRRKVEVEHALLAGTYVVPERGRTTLREWAEVYLARQPWRPNTLAATRAALEHSLVVLGDRPLSSIRKGDVQAVLVGLDKAPGTIRLSRQALGGLLQAAVEDELLAKNPTLGVKLAQAGVGEVVPPSVEVVQALYGAAPEWFRPAIVLGAGLGLRQAEASGLTVDRVDWLRVRSVRVDRQWSTKVKPFHFAPPKTTSSIRTIPAAQVVLDQLGAGLAPGYVGPVLNLAGEHVDHNRFGTAWRATVKAAGVEPVRFHDLRHHFASLLISAGCSVKAVQKALGHGKASTTLDTYAHLWPGDEDRIRDAVQVAFAGGDSGATGLQAASE